MQRGHIESASVCDHVIPHAGNVNKFWLGELQSLCATCHNASKRTQEHVGYVRGCDASGAPLDPAHPIYRGYDLTNK
jgi:hypothetical protein